MASLESSLRTTYQDRQGFRRVGGSGRAPAANKASVDINNETTAYPALGMGINEWV